MIPRSRKLQRISANTLVEPDLSKTQANCARWVRGHKPLTLTLESEFVISEGFQLHTQDLEYDLDDEAADPYKDLILDDQEMGSIFGRVKKTGSIDRVHVLQENSSNRELYDAIISPEEIGVRLVIGNPAKASNHFPDGTYVGFVSYLPEWSPGIDVEFSLPMPKLRYQEITSAIREVPGRSIRILASVMGYTYDCSHPSPSDDIFVLTFSRCILHSVEVVSRVPGIEGASKSTV